MNKNYFSDITDLFLKVKKEENIKIDENAKANIKQMLQAKISEMKADNVPTQEIEPRQSFWSMWKNQLVGVPASLAAIAVVVYAATNLNVSIPKEDFSPTRDTQPETAIETVEETKPEEFDRPLVKTAEGLLVIDYSDTKNEDRSLNKVPTKTIVPVKEEPTTFETPKVEYTDNATFVLDEPKVEINTGGGQVDEEPEPIKEVEKVENPEAQEIIPDPIDSLDADIPVDDTVAEAVIEPVTEEPKAVVVSPEVNAQINNAVSFPTYIYQDEALKSQPAFSEEKLSKLTRSKTPESVTVYYVTDSQVVVEIEENGTTKWYLFDNVDNSWTISRYEKYITDSVVK